MRANTFLSKIFIVVFVFSLLFLPFKSAEADTWGTNMGAAIFKQTMEKIEKRIYGTILGTLKQAAAEAVLKTVFQTVSGVGNKAGAMFITDWQEFLKDTPFANTQLYMNDFFTFTTNGTGSMFNYSGNCGGMDSQYTKLLQDNAKLSIGLNVEFPKVDLQSYVCDTADMFAKGTWSAFDAAATNQMNSIFGYSILSQQAFLVKQQEEEKMAATMAQAYQGYNPQTEAGVVITPGSTIKDIVSQVQDIPNKIMAQAEYIPEVISSLVMRMISQTIRQGIGNIQSNVQKEINNSLNINQSSSDNYRSRY